MATRSGLSTVLIVAGAMVVACGFVWDLVRNPVEMSGLPSHVGIISGNEPTPILVHFRNRFPGTLNVRSEDCGCAIQPATEGILTATGMGSVSATFLLQSQRLPAGPGKQTLLIETTFNGRPIVFSKVVQYTIHRRIG